MKDRLQETDGERGRYRCIFSLVISDRVLVYGADSAQTLLRENE